MGVQRTLAMALAVLAAAAGLMAQALPAPADVFDVATIKPNKSGEAVMGLRRLPDGFNATNAPAAALIGIAYELQPFQSTGGPDCRYALRGAVTGGDIAASTVAQGPATVVLAADTGYVETSGCATWRRTV